MGRATIKVVKKRLDQLLVEQKLFDSRTRAQAAIMAGQVFVAGQKIDKAGAQVKDEDQDKVEVKGKELPYVSRGGLKLEKALDEFEVEVKGKVCLDIGASTGGFTDCLLQRGAAKVYAVDVGYGQLVWKLRQDHRVVCIERTNARNLTADQLYGEDSRKAAVVVIDVSFISLTKILPAVKGLLAPGGEIIALIKPQFEAKREQVGKGGIVKDPKVHEEVIAKVKEFSQSIGLIPKSPNYLILSPITGADGNIEFLLHLVK